MALSQQVRKQNKKEESIVFMFDEDSRAVQSPFGWWRGGRKKKRQQNNKKDEEYFNRLDKVRWQKKKDEAIHPARFFFLFFFVLLYTTLKCRHTRSREQERWPVVVVQPSQSNGFTFKNMCCVCVLSWCVHSCLAPSRIRQFKGRRIKRKEEAI